MESSSQRRILKKLKSLEDKLIMYMICILCVYAPLSVKMSYFCMSPVVRNITEGHPGHFVGWPHNRTIVVAIDADLVLSIQVT